MDNKLILAVAGSGKTTLIVDQLNLEKRSIVITYTNSNFSNLRRNIICKFSHFPSNIKLMTYFTFLYSFCYRPFLLLDFKAKGINYEKNPNMFDNQFIKGTSQINKSYFMDQYCRLYGNRIAKLLEVKNVYPEINSRITKYFENLFIDEVQDFAGHDFNLLSNIAGAEIDKTFVGDFFQHTYDTSRDGNVNEKLHSDFDSFVNFYKSIGFTIDQDSLKNSHRCSPSICGFIRDNLGIEIYSNRADDTKITVLGNQEQANSIFNDSNIIKLFYREHYKYPCVSRNWGESKGENNYYDICVVLNQTTAKQFLNSNLHALSPQTKNKLYVACSRANNNLYFVEEKYFKDLKNKG